MNASKTRSYLIFLTLLNISILLAIVWATGGRAWTTGKPPVLANYLQFDAQQVLQWRQAEQEFLLQLERNEAGIQQQHNALIEAVFADELVLDKVESARLALAQLKNLQQEIEVKQLLAERAILTTKQRLLLKDILLQQPLPSAQFKHLHKNNN